MMRFPSTFTPELDAVLDRMSLLGRAMGDDTRAAADTTGSASRATRALWMPLVDTYETEHAFVLEVDLPGVQRESVDVSFDRGVLTISGERAPTLRHPEHGALRVFSAERAHGAFSRSFRLPEYVEADRIEARFADGILTVHVPKSAAARPRKIAVNAEEVAARQLNA